MEETSKYGVLGRHQPCSKERIEVLSDTIERHHSSRNTPAYCIPKVVRMETGEVIFEKVCASPRPPPQISLKHDWMKKLGSEVARQPEGEIVRQAKGSQSTNQIQNQIMVERGDPLFALSERPKHVSLVTARTSIWKKKQITIKRRDPLFAHKMSAQC